MSEKNKTIAVINRSFWPFYAVVGEALLRFAEEAASNGYSVSVIVQDHMNIKSRLKEAGRGTGIDFYPGKAITTSSSSVLLRAIDTLWFMIWVFLILLRVRPKLVYVSTDPPIIVPFIVMVYCKIFSAEYVYHLQDIHPEASNIVIPMQKWIFKILKKIDTLTLIHAKHLITITEQMAVHLKNRSIKVKPVHVIQNPAISFDGVNRTLPINKGFSFCGNAGRLQRIPLLINSIEEYLIQGGSLKFAFAGSGIFSENINLLANKYQNITYHGLVSPQKAAEITSNYEWALLPIDDEVTKYAFPSKSSSYVLSGASILAICGSETSVSIWVYNNKLGYVAKPVVADLVQCFFDIENGLIPLMDNTQKDILCDSLTFDRFIKNLNDIVLE